MSKRPPHYGKQPNTRVKRNHAVRPGDLPTHPFIAEKLSQDQRVDRILPGVLYFDQRVHHFWAEEEKGALRQLMTEKRINEIHRLACARPTGVHKKGRKEGSEHPQAVCDQESFETVTANPLKE